MQDEFFNIIKVSLSEERLGSYRCKDNADQCTTLARYLWNMAICESLYSPLQLLEVGLRNALHHRLSTLYGEKWYDCVGFIMTKWGGEQVDEVLNKIKKDRLVQTPGLVVSKLNFSFWTHLFEDHYESETNFMPKSIKFIFPNLAKSKHNRKKIKAGLEELRRLRNKVFHHERIIYWHDLGEKHDKILATLRCVSPELHGMALALDRFKDVYKNGIDPWKEKIRSHWPKLKKSNEL